MCWTECGEEGQRESAQSPSRGGRQWGDMGEPHLSQKECFQPSVIFKITQPGHSGQRRQLVEDPSENTFLFRGAFLSKAEGTSQEGQVACQMAAGHEHVHEKCTSL